MPSLLRDGYFSSQTDTARSALIVPCRVCPAASLAIREGQPYLELFRKFLRTPVYESHIQKLKTRLETERIRIQVFDSRSPHHFII